MQQIRREVFICIDLRVVNGMGVSVRDQPWVTSEKEFENTKWVIIICKSKKNRQHNGQKKKDKQRSTKHTIKLKIE